MEWMLHIDIELGESPENYVKIFKTQYKILHIFANPLDNTIEKDELYK